MPDTPRPVVDVLREHCATYSYARRTIQCGCGLDLRAHPGDALETHTLHQADALAAEGYPVTAEGLAAHDRQVRAEALREAAKDRDLTVPVVIIETGIHARAAVDVALVFRADRIAAGEGA